MLVKARLEGHSGNASLRLKRGVPIGKTPVVDIRNAHMSYVVTWSVWPSPFVSNHSHVN
jgi:surfeit locus 1 family protein